VPTGPSTSAASQPSGPAPSRRRQYPTAQIQQAYNTQVFDPVQQAQYPQQQQQQQPYPQQDSQAGLFVPGQPQAPEFFSPGLQGQTPVYQQQQHPQPQQQGPGAGVGGVTNQFSQMNMGAPGQAQGYAQDVKVSLSSFCH
jgi:protein transport protein SEC24